MTKPSIKLIVLSDGVFSSISGFEKGWLNIVNYRFPEAESGLLKKFGSYKGLCTKVTERAPTLPHTPRSLHLSTQNELQPKDKSVGNTECQITDPSFISFPLD